VKVGADAPRSLRSRDSKPLPVFVSMQRYGLLRQQQNLLILKVCAHHFSLNVPVSFRHSFAMVPTGPPRRFATTTSHGYQSISVSCHCP
jgi:hypothetical protein